MTERPTTVEEWEAAVREQVEWYDHHAGLQFSGNGIARRLDALLPPAKERVPWWEAKGRTVDGRKVASVHDWPHETAVWLQGDNRIVYVDPDGMVEVDAR